MAAHNSTITNEIIITAMDRFVWFVLLVVMSHLVTEFTRVTGYARGNRHELVPVNETLMEPKSVHNMVLYPGQQDYGPYEQAPPPYYYQNVNQMNRYPYNAMNNVQQLQQPQQQQQQQQQPQIQPQQPNAQLIIPSSGAQQGFTFSFRPLIDSIFDIPISTLRAVNNLVARLTGSLQSPTAAYPLQKSTSLVIDTAALSNGNGKSNQAYPSDAAKTARSRTSTLREEIA